MPAGLTLRRWKRPRSRAAHAGGSRTERLQPGQEGASQSPARREEERHAAPELHHPHTEGPHLSQLTPGICPQSSLLRTKRSWGSVPGAREEPSSLRATFPSICPHHGPLALQSWREGCGASQNREHILFFILLLRSWGFIIK